MKEEGGAVHLTKLALRLMYYLMNRPGQIVTIGDLNQRVWGYNAEADNTMLKNVVYHLQRKIEADLADSLIIQTVPGVGYRLHSQKGAHRSWDGDEEEVMLIEEHNGGQRRIRLFHEVRTGGQYGHTSKRSYIETT